jgi:hypothetical protein
MDLDTAKTFFTETKYSRWYISICEHELRRGAKEVVHMHHFLPKSIYPEYADFKTHPWNKIPASLRAHYVMHLCLYMHYKKTGDLLSALSNLRAVVNFSKSSRKYESFRKKLSAHVTDLWKDDEWRDKVTKSMSKAAKARYTDKDARKVLSDIKRQWHKDRDEEEFSKTRAAISRTLTERHQKGEIDSKRAMAEWKEANPAAHATMISKMKTTINSEEYRKSKWKVCSFCGVRTTPANHKKNHEEYCKENPSRVSKSKTCLSCCGVFENLGQHLRHAEECKDFYGKKPV